MDIKKRDLKPHLTRRWRIPEEEKADFAYLMEDVLNVYQRKFGENEVLVCIDETNQQTKEVRAALPTAPGRPARFDCEYERNGTVNLLMVSAPLSGWRHVKITDRRTKKDFAGFLKDIADVHFPGKKIVLITDNSNRHKLSSLYYAFPPEQAGRLRERFEIHYTPKHGGWLNIAESEIGVLSRQCLSRRIPDRETLRLEVSAWQKARNADPAPFKWRFTAEDARIELRSLYPSIQQ